MAEREVVALNESTPQLEAAQSGDTYAFPRDVTLKNNAINVIHSIDIDGSTAAYTSDPGAFVDISEDHTWNYAGGPFSLGRYIATGVDFSGTHTISGGNGNSASMGALFTANLTIVNNSSEANSFGPYVCFSANATFRADTQTITQASNRSIYCRPAYTVVNSGTLNVTTEEGYFQQTRITSGATVTRSLGYSDNGVELAGTGACTSRAGYASKKTGSATNSTAFLIGYNKDDSFPSGDWAIYQGNSDTRSNQWNGGQAYKLTRTSSSVNLSASTVTAKGNHAYRWTSGTSTLTLPLAANNDGREYILRNDSGNNLTITASGSDTLVGFSSPLATGNYLRIMGDATNNLWFRCG